MDLASIMLPTNLKALPGTFVTGALALELEIIATQLSKQKQMCYFEVKENFYFTSAFLRKLMLFDLYS